MPQFSFDESEFADEPDAAADEALRSLEASTDPDEAVEDPELADVDTRLETADYYRAVLGHEFFDVSSPASKIVDREIRAFIKGRLEILVGLRVARQTVAQFSDEQVEALRVLADPNIAKALALLASKVLGKAGLSKESGPAVKKMPTPAPGRKPEVRVKPQPQARRVAAPPAKPRVNRTPAEAPQPKPSAKSAPQSATAPAGDEPGESQTFISHQGQTVTLVEGETITENGRRYLVARNERGTLYRKDITGQVVAPGRLPPMTPQQMSIMSEQLATQQLAALDETTGLAIVASLQKAD